MAKKMDRTGPRTAGPLISGMLQRCGGNVDVEGLALVLPLSGDHLPHLQASVPLVQEELNPRLLPVTKRRADDRPPTLLDDDLLAYKKTRCPSRAAFAPDASM